MDAIEAIRSRRSWGRLAAPGPSVDELTTILEAAACAPDHKLLRPFRFTVLEGDALDAFGLVLEEAYLTRCAAEGIDPSEPARMKERTKLRRAPTVLIVSGVLRDRPVPPSDQIGAIDAACQNVLLAATALGYGSIWRTGAPCHDPVVKAALGLAEDDHIAGFIYLGTVPPDAPAKGPNRPDLAPLLLPFPPTP